MIRNNGLRVSEQITLDQNARATVDSDLKRFRSRHKPDPADRLLRPNLSYPMRYFREGFAAASKQTTDDERRALAVAATAHALHDGYTDLIYIMLPLWQAEFALSYAALGVLRGAFVGAMASLQIPAGLLAERFGAAAVLGLGTAVAGLGYCLAGSSGGFVTLLAALCVGGLGASAQHPVASALVARAFAGPRSLQMLGTYNFSGDIGKMTVPAALSLLLLALPWRPALSILGGLGLVLALAIFALTPRYGEAAHADLGDQKDLRARPHPLGFLLLLAIGIIDSATRMGFLLFLPFLLTQKGASVPTSGLAMTLIFAGGAAGKLACAFIGARIGAIATVWLTEGLTALGIVLLFPLPLGATLLLLPLIGVALNGTSSVLYGSVPELVAPQRRTRALGVFYTGTIGSSALAPMAFGLAGDVLGMRVALVLVAVLVLITLPLAALLRPALKRPPAA
jgi:MFS transporter, FSR family, fosmidomycin resistance protein